MSKQFIEEKIGNEALATAKRQHEQLLYLTQSKVQDHVSQDYFEAWVERRYQTEEYFLNWVKMVMKDTNFMAFFKFLRNPVPSSKLINNRIKLQLRRVFFSEDSHFKYVIKGDQVESPEELDADHFNEVIFKALLFNHNDILVTDLKDVNTPFRQLIPIDDVVAIDSNDGVIKQIAYTAEVVVDGVVRKGYLYIDHERYSFYSPDKLELLLDIPHDLGECPADYISAESMGKDPVRESIFSHIHGSLEEYVFLKTLQRMTDVNGTFPVVTQLDAKRTGKDGPDETQAGSTEQQPLIPYALGPQVSKEYGNEFTGSESLIQAGTVINVPRKMKQDGSIDMEAVKNFINFFYAPIEALDFINRRLAEVEDEILRTVLGDLADQTGERKNELQVRGGFASAEDSLRSFALQFSRIRKRSDFKMLALKYGRDNVTVEAFYGSDFFLETPEMLYKLFKESPNPIERKNILIKLSKNRNKFNKDKSQREVILYHLIPYVSDADFQTAITNQLVSRQIFDLQTRFMYWIGMFEARFGDIVVFWNDIEAEEAEKLILINNLLVEIINQSRQERELTPEQKTIEAIEQLSPLVATKILDDMSSEQRLKLIGLEVDPNKPEPPGPTIPIE